MTLCFHSPYVILVEVKNKKCAQCNKKKLVSEFYKNPTTGRIQPYCKICSSIVSKEYYLKHKIQLRVKAGLNRKKVEKELWENLFTYFKDHPCVDCGENDIIVLEFHHLRDKEDNVATMIHRKISWKRILAEIDKCIVLCANCHKRRTAQEQGWQRIKYIQVIA